MKNNLTEIVFVIDRSGSMHGLETDTVGGFNSMITKQLELDGEALVSTVLFDSTSTVLHDRIPLEKVPTMTENDYCPGGMTALMDALGDAIHHISNIHKYARPEDVPENTVFVITTDGLENASRRYSSDIVKKMIEERKSKFGWEFIFLAANIDAVESAATIGIAQSRSASYRATSEGTDELYRMMSDAISFKRTGRNLDTGEWKK